MSWFWIGGLGLFAIAGASLFFAFQRGEVIWDFFKAVARDIYNGLKPAILKRMPPDDEAEWRELQKRGASKEEMLAWQRARLLKKRQK